MKYISVRAYTIRRMSFAPREEIALIGLAFNVRIYIYIYMHTYMQDMNQFTYMREDRRTPVYRSV